MLFSIITPSFGQLDWLRLCIRSVADQALGTGLRVEHIVQDAGSPGIEAFAKEMGADRSQGGEEDSEISYRLSIQVERDGGMYDAINRGLRKAKGDLCAYLNCDEQYLPGALSRVVQHFQAHPECGVLFGDTIITDLEGKAVCYRRVVPPSRAHIRLCHLNTFSSSTFFRHEIVRKNLLFDTRWKSIGDAVWVHAMLDAGIQDSCLMEALSVFTLTGNNLGQAPLSETEKEAWRAMPGAPPTFTKPILALMHRLRKMRAGAYHKRSLDYAIFSQDSTENRRTFHAKNIPGTWPGV